MRGRSSRIAWRSVVLLAAVAVGACGTPAPPHAAAAGARLAIDGASNGSPSIAARGGEVVVVWAATAESATNLYASVSHDAGVTFGAPVRVNDVDGDARVSGEQAPRVAMGRDIVVVWTSRAGGRSRIRLARSTDGGQRFLPAITIHDIELDGARGWASVAIDDAGAAHVVWLDGRDAHPTRAVPAAQESHAAHGAMRQDVFQAVSSPDARTSEVRLSTNVCFCCKTSVAAGKGGLVVAAWRAIYPTNLRDMAAAVSTDGGRTFAEPTRVSEDHWQLDACPEDGPATAVGSSGAIYIAWPTIGDAGQSRKAIFYSTSVDGGRTFAPRLRVDDAGESAGGAAHPQLAEGPAGVAAVWDQHGDNGRVVRFRDLTNSGASNPNARPPVTLSDRGSAVYPSIAPVQTGWAVAWTETDAKGTAIRVRRWPN